MNIGNLISSRQLRAARVLAGLTQAELANEAGFYRDACQYWEAHGDGPPTSTQSTLDAITAALERHGVVVFRDPTPGARLATTGTTGALHAPVASRSTDREEAVVRLAPGATEVGANTKGSPRCRGI
jgi:DNA-binding XRE family transcriptional regulator